MSKNKIEDQAVFGCYSQSENKVTLALLKVLERAHGDSLLRNLIEAADGEDLPDNNIVLESQVTDTAQHSIQMARLVVSMLFSILLKASFQRIFQRSNSNSILKQCTAYKKRMLMLTLSILRSILNAPRN